MYELLAYLTHKYWRLTTFCTHLYFICKKKREDQKLYGTML